MIKRIVLGLFLIILLSFGGLTYYISTLDWNAYKDEISGKFLELTGKEIKFEGPLSVSLLPQPVMIAENISIYNPGQEKNVLAKVKKMETTVSLTSLLEEAPDINSLVLSDAEVWFEQYENGEFNWSYKEGDSRPGKGKKTNLRNLNLQNASFHYTNKTAEFSFDLNRINAELQAAAVDGPYRLDGNFTKDGEHYAIAVGIGSISSLDGIETNFSISHPDSESFLRFDGSYYSQENVVRGDFSGGSQKTSQFVNILTKTKLMDEQNQQELQFSSGFEMDESAVRLSSFVIKYSDDVEGSGSVTYPLVVKEKTKKLIDIKYEFLSFNVMHLYPIIKDQYEKFKAQGSEYMPETDFNVKLDFASKHFDFSKYAGGYLENVTLKADWTDNILTLEEFYASGVGETSLSLSGDLREDDERPHYFIKNSVISADALSFINAFGADLKSYVQSSYSNARLDFSLIGDDTNISVENAELQMDKMKINANLAANFSEEKKNVSIKINADNFNFDNYLPDQKEDKTFWAQISKDAQDLSPLKNTNFDVDFVAESAVFRSTPITNLKLSAENNNGVLNLKELSMQKVVGATMNVSGEFELKDKLLEFKDVKADITTSNIADLISQTNFTVPEWKIFKTKNFVMTATLNGNTDELIAQMSVKPDGADINYDGKIINVDKKPEYEGKLIVKTTNLGSLLEGIDIDSQNIPNKNGALNCEGELLLTGDKFDYTQAKCFIGSSEYKGDLNVTKREGKYEITSKLEADEFNLAYLFELNPSKSAYFGAVNSFESTFISQPDLSRDEINIEKYKNIRMNMEVSTKKGVLRRIAFDNLQFKLVNKKNALKLEEIETDYKGAHYAGDITITYTNPETPEVKGNLRFNNVDIGLLGGSVYLFSEGVINGTTAFESKGASLYDLFLNISGYVSMNIEGLNFKGFDFLAIQNDIASRKYSKGLFQAIRDNLQRGETQFNPFDITIAMKNGVMNVANLQLANKEVKSDVNFEIDLKDWNITSKMVILLNDVGNVPPFEISLTGLLQKPALEINIEEMVKHYDEHWKQIEEEEKIKKEEQRRKLSRLMEDAQAQVAKLSESLNIYVPDLEKHKARSKNDDNIAWYANKLSEIGVVAGEIDAMKAKAHTPDYTEEDIERIKVKLDYYNNLMSTWKEDISKRNAADMEERLNILINNRSNLGMGIQNLKTDYEFFYNAKVAELAQINMQDRLLRDDEIKKQKEAIDALIKKVENIFGEIERSLLPLRAVYDENERDDVIFNAEKYNETMTVAYNQAADIQKDLKIKIEEKVNRIKKAYEEEHKPSEVVVEENNQQPVVEAKSVETAPVPEQPEVQNKKVLKNVSDTYEKVEIINDEQPKTQGILLKSYKEDEPNEDNQNKPSSLLKEVDGAVQKASGKITVK